MPTFFLPYKANLASPSAQILSLYYATEGQSTLVAIEQKFHGFKGNGWKIAPIQAAYGAAILDGLFSCAFEIHSSKMRNKNTSDCSCETVPLQYTNQVAGHPAI